jgi:thermitase
MKKLHESLEQKYTWYKSWHENSSHVLAHWGTFIAIALIFTNLTFSSIELANAKLSADNNLASVASQQIKISKRGEGVEQDHILVKFKDSVSEIKKNQILNKHDLSIQSEISQIKVKIVKISPNDTPEEVVDRLNANEKDSIEFAEVDSIVYPDLIPNDPLYGSNWQLPKMAAPSAWDVTIGSPAIIIAILDTGTDCSHEDLAAHCVTGWNMYDNNSDSSDVNNHGTWTAGTAAAVGDNGLGIASPCYNCKIMPIRIANASGSSDYSTISNALIYAADHGAKVANISFGPLGGGVLGSAEKYFMDKGGVVVISAGNSSLNHSAADDPYAIMVSGIDPNDALYSWSDYGSDIDLAAAGCVTSSTRGGGYSNVCGTSFSAPTVSGVVGLIFSKNPSLTGYQVRNILKSNTNDIYTPGFDIYSGFGTPNMLAAVNAAGVGPIPDTIPPSASTLNGSATSATKIDLSWSPSTDNVGVVGYNLYRNGSKLTTVAGEAYSDTSVSQSSTYSYYVTAYDLAGNNSTSSNTVSITTPVLIVNVTITSKQVSNKTATTATIKWTTNINSTGSVSYGKSQTAMTSSATDNVVGTTHTVVLTDLSNLTNYYFKINAISNDGSSSSVSAVSSFKTNKK